MIYAYRTDAGWVITNMVARFAGIGGWHTLTDAERAAHGWYPCVEVNAAFDPVTQVRGPATFDLADGVVTATYVIWDKPPEQIAAEHTAMLHAATQDHIEAVARARRYNDAVSLASYVADPNPQWAAEAQAFVAWRSAVWQAFVEIEGMPSAPDFIAGLPPMVWPL